jgi:hypothetical protein
MYRRSSFRGRLIQWHYVRSFVNLIEQEVRQNNMEDGPALIHFGSLDKREKAMSDEDLKAELERLRQENAALKKGAASGIRMQVSEKGAVSIYGMGRFPVTLYKEQWLRLLDMSADIRAFIAANEAQLKTKD